MRYARAILLSALSVAAARQPFAPGDLWSWRTASDPRIAPAGDWVVFVESWNDREKDERFANLWAVSTDARQRRRLTDGPWRDHSPRWSSGGERVAWISDRSGAAQIWLRSLTAGNESALNTTGYAPLALAWSPDGRSIAFTARVPARPGPWAPPALLRYLRQPAGTIQVFVVAANGGSPRQVSTGDVDHPDEPAWMPDGQSIVTSSRNEVVAIRIADGGVKQLTKTGAINRHPLPSPDGARIAWLAADSKPQTYAVRSLYVMNADGTRAKPLAGALDRDVTSPQWSSDSRTVYFLADDRGATRIYAGRADGSTRAVTSAPARLRDLTLADNGHAVVVRSSATEGGDVVTLAVDRPSEPLTLAASNGKLLAERNISEVEELDYPSGGKLIQAWLVKPQGWKADDTNRSSAPQYPLLLDIQDAPRRMYGFEFQLRAQIFAARGYAVLCANPRGTPGYGEAFGNLLPTRLPGDDYDDLMRGVDFVAAKGYIDPARLYISGGLLAAWTIGHTDRFAGAVARRLSPGDNLTRVRAMLWDDPDLYVKHSPIFFAQSFKTPTLLVAVDRDPQAEELYFALQQRKVSSALVELPGPEHPSRRVVELEAALAWLSQP